MKKLGYKETDKQIGKVLAHLDIDNDQCINYTEFITLILDKKVYSNREKLWFLFIVLNFIGQSLNTSMLTIQMKLQAVTLKKQ